MDAESQAFKVTTIQPTAQEADTDIKYTYTSIPVVKSLGGYKTWKETSQ